jgi:hypothetical protein
MNDFWKKFLLEDARKFPSGGPRHVSLAAFGKHVGWDDHVEDLGLETESLTLAKAILYVEGIGGQIDAGAWEKLDATQQLPQFNHLFLWQRSGQYLLGKMWSSTDGKGRSRYPMIVCVHCVGLNLSWILEVVAPRLDELQAACIAAKSASEVRTILSDCLASIRRIVAELPQDSALHRGLDISAESFVRHPDLGPGIEGLLRILHQVKDQMCGYTANKANSRTNPADLRPQQIRVPICAESPAKALLTWTRFFDLQLVGGAPVLFVVPLAENWVDVTVGRPGSNEFFSLRAAAKAIPLASGIPYNIDDSVKQEGERILAMLLAGKTRAPLLEQTAPSANTGFFTALKEKLTRGRIIIIAVSLAVFITVVIFSKLNSAAKKEFADASSDSSSASIPKQTSPDADSSNQRSTAREDEKIIGEQLPRTTRTEISAQSDGATQSATTPQAGEPQLSTVKSTLQESKPAISKSVVETEVSDGLNDPSLQPESKNRLQSEEQPRVEADNVINQSVQITQPETAKKSEARDGIGRPPSTSAQVTPPEPSRPKVEVPVTVETVLAPENRSNQQSVSQEKSNVDSAAAEAPVVVASNLSSQPKFEAQVQPEKSAPSINKELANKLGLKLVWIQGLPGTPEGGWVGQYEVTQEEFQIVMGANPSLFNSTLLTNGFKWTKRLPVDSVSWIQAVEFCRKVTDQEIESGNLPKGWKYALPTDNQWMFLAAEVALTNAICGYPSQRWFPEQVGTLHPNRFGLHDVWGNLSELCVNLSGKTGAQGGSFENKGSKGLAIRENMQPHEKRPRAGFRCVVIPAS